MLNASMAAQTAKSWQSQPGELKGPPQSRRRPASRMIASPCRPRMINTRRMRPSSSSSLCRRRASTMAVRKKASPPIASTSRIEVSAQPGILAVKSTQMDEHHNREQVEHPVREHGADQRCGRALAIREVAAKHCDARDLSDAARQHRVPEQADRERREHEREPWMWRGDGLLDRRVPSERAREHREQVQADGRCDPFPGDGGECVVDETPIRPAPDDQRDRGREDWQDEAGRASELLTSRDDPVVDLFEPRARCRPRRSSRLRGRVQRAPSQLGDPRLRACRSRHRRARRDRSAERAAPRRGRRRRRTRECRRRRKASHTRTPRPARARSSHRRARGVTNSFARS